jgi:FecR protein
MKRAILTLLVAAGLSALLPLWAQDEPDGQYEPGRAVARISVMNGDVSVRRGDSGDVGAATVNGPLMADDRLLTSSNARAEVQLDSANMIRIGPNSEVRFTGMDVKSFQIQVAAGTVTFRTLRPSQAQVEVDTPSVAVRPVRPGAYRVTVRDDGSSEISVRSGEAEIDGQRGGEHLQAGRTMNARGPAADPEFQVVQGLPLDNFDRWNDERDRYIQGSQSYQHVSPDIGGAEDLDQNGQWVNDPSYGSVWQPTNVGPDWAPYQNGRWVWEDYYGWTWVSADPWGWAPYHYGRWFMGVGGWSWYPGPVVGHPYWAPAYVGFFGWGGGVGVGVGFGFGGVGWVALAPFESFHPWWGHGLYGGYRNGFYGNHTTIINNTNVYNTYHNARVPGGVMGVNAGGFGRGGQITSLNRSQIQSAGAVHGVLPVSPDRASLRMSDRSVNARFPQSSNRTFASRMQAPRVDHATFEQQQRGVQQMSRPGISTPSTSSPGHGWNRFGEPIHGSSTNGSSTNGFAPSSQSQFNRSPSPTPNAGGFRGFQRYDYSRPSAGSSGSQAVRVSPSFVAPRSSSLEPSRSNSAPPSRSFGGAPRNSSGGGGVGGRPSAAGGGHASGGGGGHGGHR